MSFQHIVCIPLGSKKCVCSFGIKCLQHFLNNAKGFFLINNKSDTRTKKIAIIIEINQYYVEFQTNLT